MSHCQCDGIERRYDTRRVTNELTHYRTHGMAKTTRLLVEALQAGARGATDVDASAAYLAAAREEAVRQGLAERVSFQHGDFVALAPTLPATDIVTLDRVICCYDDMAALVGRSAAQAEKLYGVVYPRDTWWFRLFTRARSVIMRAMRAPMRFYVYPTTSVDAMIRAHGLEQRYYQTTGPWQVVVYARTSPR